MRMEIGRKLEIKRRKKNEVISTNFKENITLKRYIILLVGFSLLYLNIGFASDKSPNPTPTQTSIPTVDRNWSDFVPPDVDFTDNATGLEGSTIFHDAIPDVTQMMKDTCLSICRQIYIDNNDPRNNFTLLHLQLDNDPKGVAGKWGDSPTIYISISAQYIAQFYHNNGNSLVSVKSEVQGILAHEGTHGYQWTPRNCGSYKKGTDRFGFVEGFADYVRIVTYGFTPPRYPGKGGKWNDGYERTGFFIDWLVKNKKSTFANELNHTAGDYRKWSWDTACRNILGEGIQSLWDQYQNSLP